MKLAADELERLVWEIPPAERSNAWRERYDRVADHMREAHDARIFESGHAARMTLHGVTCSSTNGLPSLFPNWIRKARAEMERLS